MSIEGPSARIFGLIGNRADLGARVLERHAPRLRVRDNLGKPVGWGVGFYQAGEVLLRRRPLDEREAISVAEVAEGVRTDLLVAHIRNPTVGNLRTENTHPFRYRQWLFAGTGTIGGFAALRERLTESIPEFLLRNVRGDTDSELFFFLFLSFLHDAGRLDTSHVSTEQIRTGLRSAITLVDRLSAEEGLPHNQGDVLIANGEHLVAVHRSGRMALRVLDGRSGLDELASEDSARQGRISSAESIHFTVIASDLDDVPTGWHLVPDRSVITMSHTSAPAQEALDARASG